MGYRQLVTYEVMYCFNVSVYHIFTLLSLDRKGFKLKIRYFVLNPAVPYCMTLSDFLGNSFETKLAATSTSSIFHPLFRTRGKSQYFGIPGPKTFTGNNRKLFFITKTKL